MHNHPQCRCRLANNSSCITRIRSTVCFITTHSLDRGICGCVLHRHTLSMIFACCWGYLHCKSESMGNIASSGAKNRIQEGKSLGIGQGWFLPATNTCICTKKFTLSQEVNMDVQCVLPHTYRNTCITLLYMYADTLSKSF